MIRSSNQHLPSTSSRLILRRRGNWYPMLTLVRRIRRQPSCLQLAALQCRFERTEAGSSRTRRRSKFSPSSMLKMTDGKSEWWVVDGEMHEIGENVPLRERFVIPRENIPNKRRKQLREQFMRRTRLVLKESEHEPWCKRYMELYNELRENWERLYWNEGYSKKLASDYANYDSAEDDEEDFNPNRRSPPVGENMMDQVSERNKGNDSWEKVNLLRDKFEYDRERRMRDKAFAPMRGRNDFAMDEQVSKKKPFDISRYISDGESG